MCTASGPANLPRMLRPRTLAAAALLALLPTTALATVDLAPGACPVDDADVDISILLSTDSLLGHDRDLCPHASGDDEVRGAVSSCRSCGFAGTAQEFQKELAEEVVAKVKKELKPATTAWERYANRARILEWSGAPAPVVGESWLRAAWSVRLEMRPVGQPVSVELDKLLRSLPEKSGEGSDPLLDTARALDEKLTANALTDSKAIALYASGSLWRARGELLAAEERYAKALAEKATPAAATSLQDAISRDRASMELEQSYLKKALGHFRAGLSAGEKVPKEQRAMLAFLAAECARRTGGRDEAQRLYKIAQTLAGSNAGQMKGLVEQGIAETVPAPKKSGKSKAQK